MKSPPIAKITRPKLAAAYPRKRLFKLLDKYRSTPVTWISSPAGSGKTTLVASYLDARKLPCIWYQLDEGDGDPATFFYYMGLAAKKAAPRYTRPLPLLTPEYQFGIPAFTRSFFEELFSRIKRPFTLVIDNYHNIQIDSSFHEILLNGLTALPPGITAYIVSRGGPPPALARLQANSGMMIVDWEALRFTRDETAGMLRRRGRKAPKRQFIDAVHDKTQGWAAGVILLNAARLGLGPPEEPRHVFPGALEEYFTTEIFNALSVEVQRFFLKTSLFPRLTSSLAERITGRSDAGRILAELNRRNYFTERRASPELTYQYHSLFREFLLTKVHEKLSADGLRQLQLQTASIMQEAGMTNEAIGLYLESAQWGKFVPMVLQQCPELARQGRFGVLEQWLEAIPEQTADADPWVIYWKGVGKLVVDPAGARPKFERAFCLFKEKQDSAGKFLAWAGIVETHLYAWDDLTPLGRWIDEFDEMWKCCSQFPSRDIEIRATSNMFAALFLRAPDHESLPYWESRVSALLQEGVDPSTHLMIGNYLMLFFTLKGDLEKASAAYRSVCQAARRSAGHPPSVLTGKAVEAYYFWFSGAREKSLQAVNEGLAAANSTGVHLWDLMLSAIGAYNTLAAGDHRGAEAYLNGMESMIHPGRRLDIAHYHYNLSWAAVLRGDMAQAREQADLFMRIGETSALFFINLNRIAMAHVLLLCDERRLADEYIEQVRRFLKSVGSWIIEFKYHLVRAHAALEDDDGTRCSVALRNAFEIGRIRSIYNFDFWLPAVMLRLCAKAFEYDIEVSYVRELIRRHGLLPDSGYAVPEQWPWSYRISVMGAFRIMKDDKPLRLPAKTPKKPLELFKALIAFGGTDVSEERITDALWPESAGDAAHSAFTTTLQRLRKLLGDEKVITVQDGSVSIDRRSVWVDAWAFERMLESSEFGVRSSEVTERRQEKKLSTALHALERAIALYTGHFLSADGDKSWAISMRERLRSKYLRSAAMLGHIHEQAGKYAKAVEVYERGLDVDDLAEEFYQGLLKCYNHMGKRSEALRVYERCRKTLKAALGVEPGSATEALYRGIVGRKEPHA